MDEPILDIAIEANGPPRQAEQYLPAEYPELLLQGTSAENSRSVEGDGLAGGTLSTWIFDCLDKRFYRASDGRLLITRYDPNIFTTDDLGSKSDPYQYYRIRENTGERRVINFTRVDTDHLAQQTSAETTQFVSPDHIGSFRLTEGQRDYLGLVSAFIDGRIIGEFDMGRMDKVAAMLRANHLPDSAAGVAGSITYLMIQDAGLGETDDMDYRILTQQRAVASYLGVDLESFRDWNTFQNAVNQRFSSESAFLDRVVEMFPKAGEEACIAWDWNNLEMSDRDIMQGIVRQIYQKRIVDEIKRTLLGYTDNSSQFIRFPQSESTRGLDQLRGERGLDEAKHSDVDF